MAQYRDSLTHFAISVGEILNPALFWGYKSCRDNQELIALETKLTSAFRDAEPAPFPTLGCLVAVEHPRRKEWVRARICEIGRFEHELLTAKVFLVDYGNYLPDVRVMHSLPAWALKMWPQAYLFQLRGIIPAEFQFDENTKKQVLRKSNKWVLAAEDKVRGLLRKGPCNFSWNQGQLTHAIGDVFLYIENNVRTESLSKYLTQCQYAIFDSEQFHKELVVEAVVAVANLREGFLGPDIIPVFPASPQVNESIANLHINGEKSLVSNGAVQHSEMPSSPKATNSGHPVPVNSTGEQQRLRAALLAYSNNQRESQNVESGGSDIWSTSKARKKREAEIEADRVNMNIDESQLSKQLSDMKFGDDSESAEKRLSNLLVNMKNPHLPVMVLNFQQKPLTLLSSAPFLTDIIRVLEKAGFVTPTNIQKYMWPSICRGRSVIAVGALDTGKTMGYLAPLASILLDQSRNKEQALFGPIAVVLCSSSMKAEGLEANLKHLVATNKFTNPIANRPKPESRVKIILRNGEQDPSRAALELFNGCHVLVTTPGVFKSLNEYYQGMSIELSKLSIVVLDDADILIEKCKEEVEEILNMCQQEMSSRENQLDIQLVLTARKWHPMLEKWAVDTCLNKPVTVVSAGFEQLMFGKVQPMITVVSGDSRMHQAVNFVRERHGKANILICCGENETALELGSALQAACANLIVAVNGEEKGKTSVLKKKWAELSAGGKGPVLVASDDILPSLAISDADILLHYSVPQSKYAYFLRMSSLFDLIALKQKKGPEVHIFVDVDCDEKCILTLVDFQIRAGALIPEQVSMKAEMIRKRKEQEKSLSPLCPKVCAFGVCAEMNLCADRHVLDQTDIPAADFPKSGEVKVQVSHVHDASHFSVRVQEHKDDEGNVTEASSEQHLDLAMDLDEHFSQEKSSTEAQEVAPTEEKHEMSKESQLRLLELSGDLFTCPYSLVHCVAEDFYMGGGIAVQFKEKFGGREQLYQQRKKVGQVAYLNCHDRFIFCLVTKKNSRFCTPRLEDIQSCLNELRRLCEGLRINQLAMPRICCGKDRFNWDVIRREIVSVFGEMDMVIRVFNVSFEEGMNRTMHSRQVMYGCNDNEGRSNANWSRPRSKPALGHRFNQSEASVKGGIGDFEAKKPRLLPDSKDLQDRQTEDPPKATVKKHPRIMPPSEHKPDKFEDENQNYPETQPQQDTTDSCPKISLKNVQFGVTCAIETKPGIFQRVKIVRIVFKNNEGEPVTVKIKSLDEGWTALKESSKLLYLPKHLRQIPPYTVDVFLCGVMPRDEETEWSKTADKFVKNWTEMMSRRMGNKQYFISGRIALSLGEALWLDPMECVQASATKDAQVRVFSYAERLIQVKVAVANKKHLQKLKQLCDEAKIALPEPKKTGIMTLSAPLKEKVVNPADFAFLPMNEVVPVNVSFIDSPSKFFVQPACFSDLLENLSNDLCNYQNALEKAAWKDAPREEGAFVLAKNPRNQTWSRAQIKKHSNEDVLLYFVDEGLQERVQCNHVLRLPDHLLKKLPCQAIDCSLYGVEPAMGKIWTRENVLTMLDLLLCDDNQNMTAKVVKKKKSDVTGGWHYLIRLFNEEKNLDVARALVEKDEAIFKSTEKEECWWLNDNNSGNSSDALIEFDESEPELFPVEEEEGAENSTVPKEVKQEEVVLNEEDFDVTIDDISNLFGEYSEFKTQLDRLKSLKKQEPKVEQCKEEIARSPNKKVEKLAQNAAKPAAEKEPKSCLISTCYETHFLWSQTDEFIRIKIQLFGVDDYYLRISPSQVDFACYSQGKAYCFHLHLFGYVIPNKCSHFARGLYVELKLQKTLDMMWPRLDCMERGTIGASHTIETITVDSDNDEEPNFNLDTKMTGQERVLTDIIMPDDSLPNDFDEIGDSEGSVNLKYVDHYDPLD
ncbi:Hypothetical predicted protein [Cloeon dipterum]|uniref:RNA helicase n=1 Tax=Cloeon dipterum TaxID=197152 RepID=A0A8S1BQV9_9INSE|nr:Hypothetical predicted protein [Cloeon dipterum]